MITQAGLEVTVKPRLTLSSWQFSTKVPLVLQLQASVTTPDSLVLAFEAEDGTQDPAVLSVTPSVVSTIACSYFVTKAS